MAPTSVAAHGRLPRRASNAPRLQYFEVLRSVPNESCVGRSFLSRLERLTAPTSSERRHRWRLGVEVTAGSLMQAPRPSEIFILLR
jgi:hypothetical protein